MQSLLKISKALSESSENAIVLCSEQSILQCRTYKEIMKFTKTFTNIFTHFLTEKHVCVGLLMDHNVYIPSIILSLQELNQTFVFLQPKNDYDTIENLEINWVLSFDPIKETNLFSAVHKFCLDQEEVLTLWRRGCFVTPKSNFVGIFCVIQTSGSTGKSKTVRVPYTCIEKNALSLQKTFNIKSEDVIFWGTPLSFDPSMIELLLSLLSGACLLIVPHRVYVNPNTLYKALFSVKYVTFLQMVPSVFLRWNENDIIRILNKKELKILAFGGEEFPKSILNYERRNGLRLFNLYGITEVSCWATIYELEPENANVDIPIGENLDDIFIEVRDIYGKAIKQGEGEIYIGSETRVCFLNDELSQKKDEPIFRGTGDLANINDRGIFYIGRNNKVIKRFGQRINLSKIERTIFDTTGLRSICIWSQQCNKLLAFILVKESINRFAEKVFDKLRVKILNALPEGSFPDYFKIVNSFPLTSHGKVNEIDLEKLYFKFLSKDTRHQADIFCSLWCKYSGLSTEHMEQSKGLSFFAVGGNSITALQLITEFKEMLGYSYPNELVTLIFENKFEDCVEYLNNFKPKRAKINEEATELFKNQKSSDAKLNICWRYDLRACVDGSPLVFENNGDIYIAVGSFSHIFVVLNESGKEIYRDVLPDCIQSTPTVSACESFIFIGCFNGTMYCVDFIRKKKVWEYVTGDRIKCSAQLCRNQSAIAFGSYDKRLYCLLIKDGSELWHRELDGGISANLITDESKIFATTIHGSCFCLEEDRGGIIWTYNCGNPIFSTPVLHEKLIILATVQGILFCLFSLNGKLLWNYQADNYIFSSLVLFKDTILFGCHDKKLHVIKASPTEAKLLGGVMLNSAISTTPFLYESNSSGTLIVTACNGGTIYIIDYNTLAVLGNIDLPAEVFSSPCIYSNKIFVGCRDNNLYCISIDI